MLKNFFKITWRAYFRSKTHTFITFFGLTVGLLACMLVGTVVMDDLSYDTFWSKGDNLYRVTATVHRSTGDETMDRTFANFGKELTHQFPEVQDAASISTFETEFRLDKVDSDNLPITLLSADTNLWELLDIPIVEGNPKHFIAGQNNIIISTSLKRKLFPEDNPLGKTIYQNGTYGMDGVPFVITGIMKDFPQNTYLRADAIEVRKPSDRELNREGWGFFMEQMVLIKPNTDMEALTGKVNKWYADFLSEASEETKKQLPTHAFQPLHDIYLKSEFSSQLVKGNIKNIYIFSVVAGLILLIACINFININMAKAVKEIREAGVRKVLGATRTQLVGQFLANAALTFLISGGLASAAYLFLLPVLENFLGHQLTFHLLFNLSNILIFILALLMLIVLSAVYPAWIFSGIQVVHSLKNKVGSQYLASGAMLRKGLVVFQFGIALLVLIGMITVWQQLSYIHNSALGYETRQLFAIPYFGSGSKAYALQQEIDQLQGVEESSMSAWVPTKGSGGLSKNIDDPNSPTEKLLVNFISGDANLAQTINFELLKGRLLVANDTLVGQRAEDAKSNLGESNAKQSYSKVLLNETVANLLNITSLDSPIHSMKIIPVGIIKDFHTTSFRDPINPTVIVAEQQLRFSSILLRVQPGFENQVISAIEKLWKDFYVTPMPEVQRLQDMVDRQYEKERTQQQLLAIFSGLALLLATLGVFGMIFHATAQRTKEIGIRKVLGAPVTAILLLFSKDYVKLISLALLICSPVAWYFSSKWLEDFAYRIEVQWWFFALAGGVVFIVTMITVNLQTIRAAIANPVDSLRDE